jgi:hypothetical protein
MTRADVLQLVLDWSAEDRLALAREVLQTLRDRPAPQHEKRPSFERALGIARGSGPAPTDEEVEAWIDEHRMTKYGG